MLSCEIGASIITRNSTLCSEICLEWQQRKRKGPVAGEITAYLRIPSNVQPFPCHGVFIFKHLLLHTYIWELNIYLDNIGCVYNHSSHSISKLQAHLRHVPWNKLMVWLAFVLMIKFRNVVPDVGIKGGAKNYIPQILWDVITYPCTWYRLLAQRSSIMSPW